MSTAPSSHREWPKDVKRYLTQRLLDRALEQNESWAGLAVWLYAGTKTASGETLPYCPTMTQLWPLILSDAAAWQASRITSNPPSEK